MNDALNKNIGEPSETANEIYVVPVARDERRDDAQKSKGDANTSFPDDNNKENMKK